MEFIEKRYSAIDEVCYTGRHASGLTVHVVPKPKFSSYFAAIGTKYGSIDNLFRRAGEKEFTSVPDGIAHFLEHKLFESEDGSAFEQYARTGADANAYTSFDKTVYLFSCTSQFEASLRVLLNLVQQPYFTKENVEKEQGIIGQEIRMYQDTPSSRVYYDLLAAMYHRHPVRIDIAGTEESISHITAEYLYDCYGKFYNMNNMTLAVAGPVTPEQVGALVEECVRTAEPVTMERDYGEEPASVLQERIEASLAVAMPLFYIGVKDADVPLSGEALAKKQAESELIVEMLTGEGSDFYRCLYDEGLINGRFGGAYEGGETYAYALFGGESKDPDAVYQAFRDMVAEKCRTGFDKEEFERCRRAAFGRTLRLFDSPEDLGNELVAASQAGVDIFAAAETFLSLTPDEVHARLCRMYRPEAMALSVVLPNN